MLDTAQLLHAQLYPMPSCEKNTTDSNHLFLLCNFTSRLWYSFTVFVSKASCAKVNHGAARMQSILDKETKAAYSNVHEVDLIISTYVWTEDLQTVIMLVHFVPS